MTKLSIFTARQGGLPGIITCMAPDVCKTPSPAGPVPIPYMIVSMMATASNTEPTVSSANMPTFKKNSFTSTSIGDQPGVAGGVVSNVFGGPCRPLTFDPTVLVKGMPVIRNNDMFEMNCAGPTGPSNTVGRLVMLHPEV